MNVVLSDQNCSTGLVSVSDGGAPVGVPADKEGTRDLEVHHGGRAIQSNWLEKQNRTEGVPLGSPDQGSQMDHREREGGREV